MVTEKALLFDTIVFIIVFLSNGWAEEQTNSMDLGATEKIFDENGEGISVKISNTHLNATLTIRNTSENSVSSSNMQMQRPNLLCDLM